MLVTQPAQSFPACNSDGLADEVLKRSHLRRAAHGTSLLILLQIQPELCEAIMAYTV